MIDAFDVLKVTSLNSIASTSYAAKSLVQQAITELKKTDGTHLYLPGVSSTFGVSTGNYIDSAGTQVAVIDSPVGLVVDATGVINASQSTTANKPVLTKRINLLTKTEDFSDAVWLKEAGTTVTPNTTIAPDGTLTADTVSQTGGRIYQLVNFSALAGVKATAAFYIKANIATTVIADFNGLNNAANNSLGTTSFSITTDWQRFTHSKTIGGNDSGLFVLIRGTSGQDFQIWGAQLDLGVSTPTKYQRVNTATDYDTVGFPSRWDFDSTDSLQLTFPAGYESATIIDATAAGQVTLTGQNITGAYNIGPSLSTNGRIILRDTPTQRQLYLYQNLAKRLAGL
jgi:hypothetical protein